jgi:hypothetical protein
MTRRPEPSIHAKNRWTQYADPDDDIQLAWDGALPLTGHGLHGDEARYDPEHDVVIVRKNGEFTTVINRDESMRYQAKNAVGRAVDMFGNERIDRG